MASNVLRCNDCGIEREWLHKHHIVPRSQGGGNEPENLVMICANCHEDRHGGPCGGTLRGLQTPEARAKQVQAMKDKWNDPVWRERLLAKRAEAYKARDQQSIAEKVQASWTPERRQQHSERIKEIRAQKHWVSRKGELNG